MGVISNYIRHTWLLLNPTNLDEANVQAIHIESRGEHAQDGDPSKHGEGHFKGKGIIGQLQQRRMRRKHSIALIVKGMGVMKSTIGSYIQS